MVVADQGTLLNRLLQGLSGAAQGIQTPDIAPWQRFPLAPSTFANTQLNGLIYPYLLNFMRQTQYANMWLRTGPYGRIIMAYPIFPGMDPAFQRDAESNGGAEDIVTVRVLCCKLTSRARLVFGAPSAER